MTTISNLGLTSMMTSSLQTQQNILAELSQQVASGSEYDNLTSYTPTQASDILDIQSTVTQRQSYLTAMNNVSNRLSMYDSTMTDMESIANEASDLATENETYSSSNASNIAAQAEAYLSSITDDLNQQVGGRYIYAGTRYSTQPVTDLTAMTTAPTATTTTGDALPDYDTDYDSATSFSVNTNPPAGNFTVGNVSVSWSDIASGTVSTVTVGGSIETLATPVVMSAATSTSDLAANLSTAVNSIASQLPSSDGISTLTTTSSGSDVSLGFGTGTPLAVTPDSGGNNGETTWLGGPLPDGTSAETLSSSSLTLNGEPTGSFTIGTVSIPWSDLTSGTVSTVNINGASQSVNITGLSTGGTTSDLGYNLQATLNQLSTQISGLSSVSATSNGNSVSVSFGSGTPLAITPDKSGMTGEITWGQGSTPDGTVAQTPSTSAAAYTQDSAQIDSSYSITYGISSDNPAFQQLINGIRFIQSAVTAGNNGDAATYQSDMEQAATLINSGLAGVVSLHAGVANNQDLVSQETTTQNNDISSLQGQLSDIQSVNLADVGAEITQLQTQLEASYSATATIEKLSLVNYLS